MARNPNQLTEQQIAVLAWIAEGSPPGRYDEGYTHRITARALESRGLTSITGRGSTWSAKITENGRAWLAGPHPQPPAELSEADALLQSVIDAGGALPVDWSPHDEPQRRLIKQSMKSSLRPHGKKLELRAVGSWSDRTWEVALVEHPDDLVDEQPVPVPKQVRAYHPAVKAFLADKEWSFVTPDHMTRAGHILQAIATEAERRGLVVSKSKAGEREGGDHVNTHLAIQDSDARYSIRILELSKPGAPRLAPRRWNEPKRLSAWRESRTHEFVSTGDLELRLYGPLAAYDGDRFRDRKRASLEEHLPELFRALDIYRLKRAALAKQRVDEEAQRQVRWEGAMETARERFAHAFRVEALDRQATAWRRTQELRAYLAALRLAARDVTEAPPGALEDWMSWIEQQTDRTDPLANPAELAPSIPTPSPSELTPFLHGWSPYGPNHR